MTSKPVWITKSGNLGTIPENEFYSLQLSAYDSELEDSPILFELIAGEPPQGIHLSGYGTLAGSPLTTIKVLGVPSNVSQATTSTFAVRARVADYYTTFVGDGSTTQYNLPVNIDFDVYKVLVLVDDVPVSAYYVQDDTQLYNITAILNRAPALGTNVVIGVYSLDSIISDRTFDLTVVGENPPDILNPETIIGEYVEGDFISYQITAIDLDEDTLEYSITNGTLPPGITIDSATGLISGYVRLITFSTTSTTRYKSFSFAVIADDGKLQDLQTFEIRVVPSKLMAASATLITADTDLYTADRTTKHNPIILNEAGEIGPYKHDNYFMYKFNGLDLDNDVIIYEYDLGEGVGYDQLEAPYDTIPFDTTVAGSVEGAFPPGLVLDPDTGWLYGYLPAQSDIDITYCFYVRASKKYVFEQGYPGVDPVPYYSERKQYCLTVTGLVAGTLTWISDSFLGSLDNGDVSQFQIEATVDNGNTLYYELVSGEYNRMVPGLELLSNGMIVGRATFATFSIDSGTTTFDKFSLFIDNETTFDQTYTFTVRAYDLEGTVSTTKQFTILINRENPTPYENLYFVGRLPLDERTKLIRLLDNRLLIPEEDVYRYGDTNFGIQYDLRMLVVNGLTPTTAADMITAMSTMHFTKTLNFGLVKTAKVVDSDLNTVYEVVYIEIKDTTDTDDGVNVSNSVNVVNSNITDTPVVFPNNIVNMRKSLISQLGQVNKELPKWMVDRQDDGRVLGFTKGCVIAYTKPGRSAKIAYQINALKALADTHSDYFDFKRLSFGVDRYLWDTDLLSSYDKAAMEFVTEAETTFDIYGVRYDYVIENGLRVYFFNPTILVHGPDGNVVDWAAGESVSKDEYLLYSGLTYRALKSYTIGATITIGGAAPGSPAVNDLWYDTVVVTVDPGDGSEWLNGKAALKKWSGSKWIVVGYLVPQFHADEPEGHYGSEYVNDPDATPNANKTTFDGGSLRFLVGRDVYKDQDTDDKYLKFPDNTILGV